MEKLNTPNIRISRCSENSFDLDDDYQDKWPTTSKFADLHKQDTNYSENAARSL